MTSVPSAAAEAPEAPAPGKVFRSTQCTWNSGSCGAHQPLRRPKIALRQPRTQVSIMLTALREANS